MTPTARHLVDEILEEIFLRLPTPAALARASTASPRFRRIITERAFLRRFLALHPPPLLGFAAGVGGFYPAQDPHPSAPLARAIVDAADFTYSFVPKAKSWFGHWHPCDARDGRLLLEASYRFDLETIPSHAVCDPLSRRYVVLPAIPEETTIPQERLFEFRSILAPIAEDEDETSFKVIFMANYKSKLLTYVFSSVTLQWCVAASISWGSLGTADPYLARPLCNNLHSFFYWDADWRGKLFVLDTCRREFYIANFAAGNHRQLLNKRGHGMIRSSIAVGTDRALEMFSLIGDYGSDALYGLYHTTQQNDGESFNEWQLKNVAALPRGCLYDTVGATEGFMVLRGYQEPHHGLPGNRDVEDLFSLDLKTSELTKVCRVAPQDPTRRVCSYFGFPPSLSKPSL
ncbi:hypothetical protein CFC21_091642 [Triticum aestivum]|uniref:F-box domain-containing protein n=2 Tax=Triticum aestivum TaxID=4565 RepID=A0A3B6QDT5_WHEAT|nr:uncharacterized protein LOC123141150 [Triticum aestivum]KAF7088541.1 hypothetical protein CFC21_091642 [Triticum aestivum]